MLFLNSLSVDAVAVAVAVAVVVAVAVTVAVAVAAVVLVSVVGFRVVTTLRAVDPKGKQIKNIHRKFNSGPYISGI